MTRLVRYAWFVIGWNVVTILLGALVRATHSGAGCGRSWPTCQGQLVPELGGATTVEFTHRAASGLALALTQIKPGLSHGMIVRRRRSEYSAEFEYYS